MAAFINAPAVILAASHEVGRFPKVLTIIACPDLTCLAVNRHPPGIAQTVGPELRSCIFPADKWVVLRHRVGLRSVRMIRIDAQHTAEKVAQVLAGHPPIGVARSVARGDVKHPIVTEHDSTAIMSRRTPLDNQLHRLWIASVRRLTLDGESRDAVGALRLRRRAVAEHKEVSVG